MGITSMTQQTTTTALQAPDMGYIKDTYYILQTLLVYKIFYAIPVLSKI